MKLDDIMDIFYDQTAPCARGSASSRGTARTAPSRTARSAISRRTTYTSGTARLICLTAARLIRLFSAAWNTPACYVYDAELL